MNRMFMTHNIRMSYAALALLALVLGGCAASGPATSFYSLFPEQAATPYTLNSGDVSIGVGPIKLPEFLENPSVVSLTDGQRIRVSGYHAWAGNIRTMLARVLSDNLAYAFPNARVDSFPWDNRIRPQYQLRVEFNEFAGRRGGEIRSSLSWTLLNKKADAVLASGLSEHVRVANSNEVEDYVAALNQLLNLNSEDIAKELSSILK